MAGTGSEGDDIIEVQVNRARCIATKSCINTAPGVFRLDEVRISSVIDPRGEPLELLIEAAENCPTASISVFVNGEKRA